MSRLPELWVPLVKTDEDRERGELFTTVFVHGSPDPFDGRDVGVTQRNNLTEEQARAALLAIGLSATEVREEFARARAVWARRPGTGE